MIRTISYQEFFRCKCVADKTGGMPENKGMLVEDTIYLNPTMLAMIQVAARHELPKLLEGLVILDFTEHYRFLDKPLPMTTQPPKPLTELEKIRLRATMLRRG